MALLRVFALLFALFAAALGGWILALPLLAYVFYPLFRRGRGRGRQDRRASAGEAKRGVAYRKLAGVALLLLGVAAFFSGGTLSPIVFSGAGFLLLFGNSILDSLLPARVRAVGDSILLRSRFLPLRWFAIAELKVSTRNPEGRFSGLRERLLLLSTPAPRFFLILSAASLGRTAADEGLLKRLQATARCLVPLGVYLLPLDGKEAFRASQSRAATMELPPRGLQEFLSSTDYAGVLVEAQNGFVTSLELYARGEEKGSRSLLSEPKKKPSSSILLRELLQAAKERIGVPQPDGYVTFLSSMAATQGETLGERITETVQSANGDDVILVSSLGGPQVELTRAQLRAVTRIYE